MPTMKAVRTKLKLIPLSKKQEKLMTWWMPGSPYCNKDMIITDGSVRSGKTIIGSMSYVLWAMYSFNHTNFGIAGKSLDSLTRNLWVPLRQWLEDIGISIIRLRDTGNGYILRYSHIRPDGSVAIKENYFYLFGGKDARSASFVQGFTSAGFFFDEVALMPEEFVNQAMARCSVEGNKIWFNCNPEGPFHWFKKQWVDKAREKNALRIQFKMTDNPSLSEKTLKMYKNRWKGVFYQRFVLGEWVMAEGSIYEEYIDNEQDYYITWPAHDSRMVRTRKGINVDGEYCPFDYVNIGLDFGGRNSGHAICATAITRDYKYAVVLKSRWMDAKGTTPDDVMEWALKFIKRIRKLYGDIDGIYADSAEQLLINLLRQKTDVPVYNSIKEEINDRIKLTIQLMSERRMFIVKDECDNVCDFFKTATYDPKSQKKDKRLDDGSYDQDSGDAFEYSIEPQMYYLIQEDEESA